MNGASPPAHWIAFAIHPDDHEARPGPASSLTKPREYVRVCARGARRWVVQNFTANRHFFTCSSRIQTFSRFFRLRRASIPRSDVDVS